jgi:hypothetical protein
MSSRREGVRADGGRPRGQRAAVDDRDERDDHDRDN